MRAITSARVSGGVISGSVCSNLDGHLQNETMLGVRVAGIGMFCYHRRLTKS